MGVQIKSSSGSSATRAHNIFLLCNYILLGAASSCIFLILSLRLFPSLPGFCFILLQVFTIAGAVTSSTTTVADASDKWHAAHLASTVLTAIFQGSVALLVFSRTQDFLRALNSYVREEDGAVIVRLGGGLCVVIFCLEWVLMTLAFALRYYSSVDGGGEAVAAGRSCGRRSARVEDDEVKDWPWPFQV